MNGVDNELLEQVSFSLDLLNLDGKLTCTKASADYEAGNSVYLVEEALRTNGARAPIDEKPK